MTHLCIPAPEAQGERFHWCRDGNGCPEPCGWRFDLWCLFCDGRLYTPAEMGTLGYRWIGIAKPPEGA